MNIHDRNKAGLFEQFILLDDLILYCCRIGVLNGTVRNIMNIRIRRGDWIYN